MTEHRDTTERDPSSLGLHNEWRRLDSLLDTLLDAPPDQRDVVARTLSDGVEAVYTELRSLAAECERNHPFLDRPAAERFASLLGADSILLSIPDVVAGRYRIVSELGQGGMACVYRARDLKHSRDVAVKVLRSEFGAVVGHVRFLREIEIVAQLQHPHIVPLHDSGESDGLLYYVMPYEDGLSLRQRLERDGPLPVAEAISILRDVCEALAHAHAHGIVHRDIKPDNVLLSANHALVADFGISRLVTDAAAGETRTVPGMLIGTPAYMAPEQATPNAQIDHRADLYAFGVLAYELLVGKPPFAGGSYDAILAAHLTRTPTAVKTLVPAVPAQLDELIMRCLAKQPADRWQNGDEILRELDRISAGGASSRSMTTSSRRWRRASLATGLAGLAVLPVVWWRTHDRSDIDPNRVAVVRFRNRTSDSTDVFGWIVADVITNGLARTEAVNVVPAAAVMEVMAPRSRDVVPNDLPSIARATGAGIIVTGSYFRQGDSLSIQAEIIDVRRDRQLAPIDLVTVPLADQQQQRGIVAVLERVTVALSGRVNPRVASLVAVAHLPMSMAAYREYAEALDLYFRGETRQALPHAYEAIRLDPTSTSAVLWAALMEWGESYDLAKVDSLLRLVQGMKAQLPPYDLAHFEWLRAYLDGDLEAVLGAAQRRPDLAGGNAVVQASMRLNRLDTAYALITQVMKRPFVERHPISWQLLTQILHMRGEYDRELQAARNGVAEVRRAASDSAVADLLGYEIRALAALGMLEDVRHALEELHTLRPTSDVFAVATRELRWHGHPDAAVVIGRLAEQWYRDALSRSSDGRARLALAETLFYLERWNAARAAFDTLAAEVLPAASARKRGMPAAFASERGLSNDIIPFAYLGIDDARRGDTSAANTAIDRLVAFDRPYQLGERQFWQAQIAAQLGQCERTVALFRESLDKGTSVYLRLEELPFKRLESCPLFQTFRDRPR